MYNRYSDYFIKGILPALSVIAYLLLGRFIGTIIQGYVQDSLLFYLNTLWRIIYWFAGSFLIRMFYFLIRERLLSTGWRWNPPAWLTFFTLLLLGVALLTVPSNASLVINPLYIIPLFTSLLFVKVRD